MLQQIKSLLASSDPATLVGSAAVLVFFAVLFWRKVFPRSWNWLEAHIPLIDRIQSDAIWTFVWKAVQTLPGALIGAGMTALASGGDLQKTLLGALAGPVASIGHELLKRYKGQVSKPGDRGLPPSSFAGAAFVGAGLGGLVALCCLALGACASWQQAAKSVDQAALILCDVFFAGQPQSVGLSPEDIEKAFCSTAEQVAPFLSSAKIAAQRGGAVRLGHPEQ